MAPPHSPAWPGAQAFARLLPKVELHCHFLGALRPSTAAELARANAVPLAVPITELYERIESPPILGPDYEATAVPLPREDRRRAGGARVGLLEASRAVASVLRHRDDFARAAYEAQCDARRESNVVYRELFFEPGLFVELGVDYRVVLDGILDGLAAAERDAGIAGRLIAGIDRRVDAAAARELVDLVVAHPRPGLVGIGLEGSELLGPPERFADAYAVAAAAGLRRCAHAGEHVPSAVNVLTCLDLLGCDRIDHGYFVLEDEAALRRCVEEGVAFTAAFTTSRTAWIPWRRESIGRMLAAGCRVSLGSDDPAMFPTTLAAQYLELLDLPGTGPADLVAVARTGIDASFATGDERRELARELEAAAASFAVPR